MARAARAILLGLLLAGLPSAGGDAREPAPADWNPEGIRWVGFERGMARLKRTGRPGLLVFYTDWCPHCRDYSRVFHDRDVVELSRRFVMMRVDRDESGALNELYGERGTYVPRTLFLTPQRSVDWSAHGANRKYPHFLDTDSPEELVGVMRRFLARQAASSTDAQSPKPAR